MRHVAQRQRHSVQVIVDHPDRVGVIGELVAPDFKVVFSVDELFQSSLSGGRRRHVEFVLPQLYLVLVLVVVLAQPRSLRGERSEQC